MYIEIFTNLGHTNDMLQSPKDGKFEKGYIEKGNDLVGPSH